MTARSQIGVLFELGEEKNVHKQKYFTDSTWARHFKMFAMDFGSSSEKEHNDYTKDFDGKATVMGPHMDQ